MHTHYIWNIEYYNLKIHSCVVLSFSLSAPWWHLSAKEAGKLHPQYTSTPIHIVKEFWFSFVLSPVHIGYDAINF